MAAKKSKKRRSPARRRKAPPVSQPDFVLKQANQSPKLGQVSVLLLGTLLILITATAIFLFVLERQLARDESANANTVGSVPHRTPTPSPLVRQPITPPVPILLYHYVRDYQNPHDWLGEGLSISPQGFAGQLDSLKQDGYQTVTFVDIAQGRIPAKPVMITLDDGQADAFTAAYPALRERGMRAVFYIVLGFVDTPDHVTWENVKELAAAGMEIGAHTMTHPELPKLTAEAQHQEIVGSIETIQSKLNRQVVSFAYPYGLYNQTSLDILRGTNIFWAVTTNGGIAREGLEPLALPRLNMGNHAVPQQVIQVFSAQ